MFRVPICSIVVPCWDDPTSTTKGNYYAYYGAAYVSALFERVRLASDFRGRVAAFWRGLVWFVCALFLMLVP